MRKLKLLLLALCALVGNSSAWAGTLGTVTMGKQYTIRCVYNNTANSFYSSRYFVMSSATSVSSSYEIPNDEAGYWTVSGSETAATITNVKYPSMKLTISSSTFKVDATGAEFNLKVNCILDGANSLQQGGVMWGLLYSNGGTGKFTGTTAYNMYNNYSTDFVFEEAGHFNIPQEGKAYFFVNTQQKSSTDKTLTGNQYVIYAKSANVADVQAYTAGSVPASAMFVAHTVDASTNRVALRSINGNYLQRGNSNGVLTSAYTENYSSESGNVLHVANVALGSNIQVPKVSASSYVELRGFRKSGTTDAPLIVNGYIPQLQTGTGGAIIRSNSATDFYSTALTIVSAEEAGYTAYKVLFSGNGTTTVSAAFSDGTYGYSISSATSEKMPYVIVATAKSEAEVAACITPQAIEGFETPTVSVDATGKTITVTYVQQKSQAWVDLGVAITTATTKKDGMTIGTNPGFYAQATQDALAAAIVTAQGVLDSSNDDAVLTSAKETLDAAIEAAQMIGFVDGHVYNIISHQMSGTTYMFYNNNGELATSTSETGSELKDMFVHQKVGDYHVFMSASSGDYLLFTGVAATSPYAGNGFQSQYNKNGAGENGFILNNHNEQAVGYYTIGALRNRPTDSWKGWATWYISSEGGFNANSGSDSNAFVDAGSTYFSFTDVTSSVHVYDVDFSACDLDAGGVRLGDFAITKGDHTQALYLPSPTENPDVAAVTVAGYVGEATITGNTVKMAYKPYTANITAAGWATAYVPFAATVSEGVTAYQVAVDEQVKEGVYRLLKTELTVIPAGTGVLLKSNTGDATTATFTTSTKEADNVEGNLLVGYATETLLDAGGYLYYKLCNGTVDEESVLGFFWAEEDGTSITCPAHKAVLRVPASIASSIKGFSLDDETAIANIDGSAELTTQRYNLAGQRVNAGFKGIVIENGKKVLK